MSKEQNLSVFTNTTRESNEEKRRRLHDEACRIEKLRKKGEAR